MTDMTRIKLDSPIQRPESTVDELQLRKPKAGELRGLSLVDLGQLKVDALTKLLPRITIPTITEVEAANMDPADLVACGMEVGSFLLKKSQLADAPNP